MQPPVPLITRFGRRLSYARFRRAGVMLMVAACKLALLLSMLEAAGHTVESNTQTCESLAVAVSSSISCRQVNSLSARESDLAVRRLRQLGSASGENRAREMHSARGDGHRLRNDLLAPMQC